MVRDYSSGAEIVVWIQLRGGRDFLETTTMTEIPQIQIHEAKKKFDGKDCTFVDIRDPASYRAAHIPGAIHINDGNVQEFLATADKSKEIVVYCYHGNSSLGAVAYF